MVLKISESKLTQSFLAEKKEYITYRLPEEFLYDRNVCMKRVICYVASSHIIISCKFRDVILWGLS